MRVLVSQENGGWRMGATRGWWLLLAPAQGGTQANGTISKSSVASFWGKAGEWLWHAVKGTSTHGMRKL